MIVSSFFHPGLVARGFHFKSAGLVQPPQPLSFPPQGREDHDGEPSPQDGEHDRVNRGHPAGSSDGYISSPSSSSCRIPAFFSSWMFRPSPRISLHNTSKLTGVPAS